MVHDGIPFLPYLREGDCELKLEPPDQREDQSLHPKTFNQVPNIKIL
jgi:hypothetical protein